MSRLHECKNLFFLFPPFKEGLSIESFNSSVRDYALPGGYRHMLIKPKNLEWSLLDYEDENEPLNSIDDDEVIESSFLRKKPIE